MKTQHIGDENEEQLQRIIQTGAQFNIHWTLEELSGTNWKPGWYKATVNDYDCDTDTLTYTSEPGIPYEDELVTYLIKSLPIHFWVLCTIHLIKTINHHCVG